MVASNRQSCSDKDKTGYQCAARVDEETLSRTCVNDGINGHHEVAAQAEAQKLRRSTSPQLIGHLRSILEIALKRINMEESRNR